MLRVEFVTSPPLALLPVAVDEGRLLFILFEATMRSFPLYCYVILLTCYLWMTHLLALKACNVVA